METRRLLATINGRPVGTLSAEQGLWSFTYDPGWVTAPDAYPLSPALPLRAEPHVDLGTSRPVQWYFDNLLPEEGARSLLAKDAKLDAEDAFGLLGYYGAESAGSLTLLAGPRAGETDATRPFEDADLQARIDRLPHVPLSSKSAKRMSLAGAQHKLAVVVRDGRLFEPVGHTPSSHILKPDHPDADYPHTVINEYFTMRLAGLMGLRVPAVQRRYVPSPVYLVERFDRDFESHPVARLHLIDACQALNLDRQFKYAAGSMARLAELAACCTAPAAASLRIYSWLVFNLLTGNADAHLKNLSFLVTRRGIELSPCYDLLCVAVYDTPSFGKSAWPNTALAWPLDGKARFTELIREDVLAAGRSLGLGAEVAARIHRAMVDRIEMRARDLIAEIEKENADVVKARPALAATFAGELRCLRAMAEVVIRDMAARLR